MNPMTNMKNVKKLSEQELKLNMKTSWHDQYKDSAWLFVGGLPYDLSEGDVICVFSQYGEVVNINFVRDKDTGKFRGFCFICYEDQRSTVLAVDNFNGIKICGRTIRVDHVADYKAPKGSKNQDPDIKKIQDEGCAPVAKPIVDKTDRKTIIVKDEEDEDPNEGFPDQFKLPPRLPIGQVKEEKLDEGERESSASKESKEKSKKKKKDKKHKKEKKAKKKKRKRRSSSSESSSSSEDADKDRKKKRR